MTNELVPISDIERMANAVAKSGMFGVKNPDQAMALMLVAQAEGLHPAIAARDYHIISGRPALKADAMLARFQQAGGSVKWTSMTDTKVAAVFTHPQGGSIELEWTIEMAKRANLSSNDNWRKYPRAMLRARCISEGIRTVFPGVVVGSYTPEEVRDEPAMQMRDVTPPADDSSLDSDLTAIRECDSMEALHRVWKSASAAWKQAGRDLAPLTAAKDAKKAELTKPVQEPIDIDPDTGEIMQPADDEVI